jgi:ribose-phosphate pyrophosphokinase
VTDSATPEAALPTADQFDVYTGNANPELARNICRYLGIDLGRSEVFEFANENIFVRIVDNAREKDVFLIQPTSRPVNTSIMELLIMIDAFKRASAGRITAVVPYYAYGRSDKKDQPRVPITARLVADMIEIAGADRYVTMDLHAGQIQGFFSIPGDVVSAFYILMDYLKEMLPTMESPVVVTADLGFAKKARNFAAGLQAPMAFIEKRRSGNDSKAQALTILGDVTGHDVIIVDDEIDTGGSIVQAVNLVKAHGAARVYVICVHAVLSATAAERLAALPVDCYITTNTVPISETKRALLGERLKILSVAPLLGEVICRANEGRSVGEMFNE